jgi:outer membrane biosynthesis protein TonB
MASSKKKKSPKKPVAKKKAAPKGKANTKTKVKAKAKPAAKKKAAPKKKPAAKKAAPQKTKTKKAPEGPTHGDAWGNASLAPKVAKTTPKTTSLEPSGTPTLALHDHEGGLISAVGDEEELAERIHGGEEAVKNEDADDDAGSPRLDDREDSDTEE